MSLILVRLGKKDFTFAGKHQDIILYRAARKEIEIVQTTGTWLGIADDIGGFLDDRADLIQNFLYQGTARGSGTGHRRQVGTLPVEAAPAGETGAASRASDPQALHARLVIAGAGHL
jgi:hypothetical protein